MPRNKPDHRGFTIIEFLIVVGIITLLVAMAFPALSRARHRAKDVVSLVQMRQMFIAQSAYGDDEKDYFPYMGTPREPKAPLHIRNGEVIQGTEGWCLGAHARFWSSQVVPYLSSFGGDTLQSAMVLPRGESWGFEDPYAVTVSRYNMTHTTFTDSRYWVGDNPPRNPALFRAARRDEVAFPSQKGILIDISGASFGEEQRRLPDKHALVMFADGSSRDEEWTWEDPERTVERPFGAFPWFVFSTRGGLAGRDY